MPEPDDLAVSVVVACEGPAAGTIRVGPLGPRRSRDGAELLHVEADARHWHETFREHSLIDHHLLLVNPTRVQVIEALLSASKALAPFSFEPEWQGGQVNFAFAGHGSPDGGLVLNDGEIGGDELLDAILSGSQGLPGKRRLGLVFDSCHSGRTLAQVFMDPRHTVDFLLIDGFAASLHDELAWELEELEHGALTFSRRNRGNAHVDQARLARAARTGDESYLRFALQAFTPNPVTYLTQGDQTAIDFINGHHLTVEGGGEIEILERTSIPRFLAALERARDAAFGEEIPI